MTRLPDDICRCRDADCPERETCARWIQRDEGVLRVVSAPTLWVRPLKGEACPYRIPVTQLAIVRYDLYEVVA